MIATGTDVKPVEVVVFMRSVKSSSYFEQMKGRGVRVVPPDVLNGVTPAGHADDGTELPPISKDRFVIVDAVGVCQQIKSDKGPLDRQPTKTLKQVFDYVKAGGTDPDAVSALAAKLTRLSGEMSATQQDEVRRHADGKDADDLARALVAAINDSKVEAKANELNPGVTELSEKQLEAAEQVLIKDALKPFYNPQLRDLLLQIKQDNEQTIDHVSKDEVLSAAFSQAALDKARTKIENFRKFIEDHKDELTVLQVFFGQATPDRLRFRDLKELAEQIRRPPVSATTEELWRCYEALEAALNHGKGGQAVTDLVSLIRHTLQPSEPLTPFPQVVRQRYADWLIQQSKVGVTFTAEQQKWLDRIADHVAMSLAIEMDDLRDDLVGGAGSFAQMHNLFGDRLQPIIAELNRVLTA